MCTSICTSSASAYQRKVTVPLSPDSTRLLGSVLWNGYSTSVQPVYRRKAAVLLFSVCHASMQRSADGFTKHGYVQSLGCVKLQVGMMATSGIRLLLRLLLLLPQVHSLTHLSVKVLTCCVLTCVLIFKQIK